MNDATGQITKDDSAWVSVKQAQGELLELAAMFRYGVQVRTVETYRALIHSIQSHVDAALELHDEYADAHTVNIPPMAVRDSQGRVYPLAGGAMSLEDAIAAGLVQVVTLKTEQPLPGAVVMWTPELEGHMVGGMGKEARAKEAKEALEGATDFQPGSR